MGHAKSAQSVIPFCLGRLSSKAAAPTSSLTCPAITHGLLGLPFASVTACSLMFMPPVVRAITIASSSSW